MISVADSATSLASVIFLSIPGFAQKPVAEQFRLRANADAAVAAAIASLDEADRVVLDAPDGSAIVVLASPALAMLAARRALAAGVGAQFGAGINYGPIQLASDHRDARLIGDGIDAAVIIAGAAPAGELLVSRAFRDALAAHAPNDAAKFRRSNTFTDTRVRTHELYSLDVASARSRSRRRIAYAALASMAILGVGNGVRYALQSLAQSRQPAVIVFDIRPQGDIYLDGVIKGRAPAMAELQVAPGLHKIEVRNGKFAPFATAVNLAPGEQMRLKHAFIAPVTPVAQQKPRSFFERLKFWQR
jgi:hypothetical protein